MKKLFNFRLLVLIGVLIMNVSQLWASTSVTFYLALDAAKTRNNNNCCAVQARIKYGGGGNNDNWSSWMSMTKTGNTYNGKLVYSQAFTFPNDGWHCWEFRMLENGNEHWYKSIHCGFWISDCHNGDVYVYEDGEWVDSPSWDDSYTVYFVNYGNWGAQRAYAWNNECDYNASHPGATLTSTGMQYNSHDIYKITLNKRYGYIQFNCNSSDCKTGDLECYSNAGKMYTGSGWIDPTATSGYTFSNGATVVWDMGDRTDKLGETHMYYEDWEGDHDILLDVNPSINQHYYTASKEIKGKCWIMRGANTWGQGQTTDITENISNYTLFQYDGSADVNYKINWQVTHNAKKMTGGKKVYFDNTDAKWSSIYLKYGTPWFTRATSAATKVTGTDNLYYITIPHEAYYKEYFLCDATGSVGYNDIETMTSINNRINYQESNIGSEITYIPSSGAGTPKVWTTSTMSGHTHDVTISAPSHGTITVAYTNESGSAQSPTSGTFSVARTCSLTVSSSAATGYKRKTLTIDGNTHTSGNTYIIKKDITVAGEFEAKQSTITFDKNGGEGGADGTTGEYDADMTTVTIPHKLGYKFDGYWDSETDGNGSGNQYYKADGTSNQAWNKDTEDPTTLHAKWVADINTFTGTGSWTTTARWSAGELPSTYTEVHISGDVTLSSPAHVGTVVMEDGGKLTIETTGSLEVEDEITNSDPDKLVVKPRGALIYEGSTYATVELSLTGNWQLIAIPVGGVDVSRAFAGSGVYTYVWDNSEKGWERRGYYDGLGAHEAILVKGSSGYNFSGYLIGNSSQGGGLSYNGSKANGDVNMFGNSWPSPFDYNDDITFSGSSDNAFHVFNGSGWTGITKNGVIPAMQGFAVLASSGGGYVTIPYSAARGVSSPNERMYAPQRTTSNLLDHITIYVSGNEWQNRICLYENEQFTEEIDKGYEALHMEGEGYAGELYAQGLEKMNVLAVSDLEGTVVGFIPGEATNYTISFEGDGRGYYLNDLETQQSTLIAEGNTYMFTPSENDAARFIVSKTPINKVLTGVDQVSDGTKVRKQMIDGTLYIIRDGRIYDATGVLVK